MKLYAYNFKSHLLHICENYQQLAVWPLVVVIRIIISEGQTELFGKDLISSVQWNEHHIQSALGLN